MDLKRQASAPLYEAIEKFRKKRIVPFDVPGHREEGVILNWLIYWERDVLGLMSIQ